MMIQIIFFIFKTEQYIKVSNPALIIHYGKSGHVPEM